MIVEAAVADIGHEFFDHLMVHVKWHRLTAERSCKETGHLFNWLRTVDRVEDAMFTGRPFFAYAEHDCRKLEQAGDFANQQLDWLIRTDGDARLGSLLCAS